MATSGKVSSNGYQGRYITFSWSLSSQSVKANTSTIAWRLEGDGTGQSSRYKAGNFKVVIDGTTVYSTSEDARIWLYDGTLVASGNFTLAHNNAGNKSFSVQIQAGIYTYAVNCTGSASFTLPTISRVSNITAVNGTTTSDVISVNYTEYVSSYTNNLIVKLGSTTLETITNYTSGATFSLSDEALQVIYNNVTSASTATLSFSLQTYDGSTLIGTSDSVNKALTINDSAPSIGTVSYLDTNSTTTAITSDNQKIIRNKSTLQVNFANLTAINGATLSNINIAGAGINQTQILSGTSGSATFNLGTINQSSNFTLTATLTDSRGNKATRAITITVLDYVAPTATVTAARQDNYYSDTDVTVNANYSSLGGNNTISIVASYAIQGQSIYTDVTLQDGVTTTLNLDNTKAWYLRIILTDKLSTVTYRYEIGLGLPIFFVDTSYRAIGINCFPQKESSLEVNGLRLDDYIYIGSQSIYDYYESSAQGESVIATAYDYRLIEGVFSGIAIPSNYEKAYKITFQYTTANNNIVNVKLNNITSYNCNTWSADKFRSIGATPIFKQSDLVLETCSGYSRDGLNLSVSNSAAYTAKLWSITVHGYLINKDTNIVNTYDIDDVVPEQA